MGEEPLKASYIDEEESFGRPNKIKRHARFGFLFAVGWVLDSDLYSASSLPKSQQIGNM